MRLEWIDDLLAVLDAGSLARAAERRHLTQSAFTRRVRMIEQSVGAPLFDRRGKPVTLTAGMAALEPELRELSRRLHGLRQKMRHADLGKAQSVSFVCQHALTTTISPRIVRSLSEGGGITARVRSGNQDECLMQLISREVDFAVMYGLPETVGTDLGDAFEARELGQDWLLPVTTPAYLAEHERAETRLISYPSEVFLGQVFAQSIAPRLPEMPIPVTVAETALTLAVLQLVLSDLGLAWLPQSLVEDALSEGKLVRLDDTLPSQRLLIRMVRLSGSQAGEKEQLWQDLTKLLSL